jgi:D-alanyl-D-alanine carboxypeptidase (penicillin-binding protein 5/6)
MKKNRLSSFLLALSLTLGLLAPMGAAQATESRSAILDGMEVEATAAILVDTTYGSLDVLYDQNSPERRYPASITKVMTALLTVEAVDNGQLSLDDWITVGPEVNHEVGSGSSTQNIKEGEVMRLEDVLYCALTASANEACNVLAQAVAGSVPTLWT